MSEKIFEGLERQILNSAAEPRFYEALRADLGERGIEPSQKDLNSTVFDLIDLGQVTLTRDRRLYAIFPNPRQLLLWSDQEMDNLIPSPLVSHPENPSPAIVERNGRRSLRGRGGLRR